MLRKGTSRYSRGDDETSYVGTMKSRKGDMDDFYAETPGDAVTHDEDHVNLTSDEDIIVLENNETLVTANKFGHFFVNREVEPS